MPEAERPAALSEWDTRAKGRAALVAANPGRKLGPVTDTDGKNVVRLTQRARDIIESGEAKKLFDTLGVCVDIHETTCLYEGSSEPSLLLVPRGTRDLRRIDRALSPTARDTSTPTEGRAQAWQDPLPCP